MNISNLFSFSTYSNWNQPRTQGQSVHEASPLALAVQRADQRVQSEVTSNSAQLSAFGQIKSSVSQVQIAARGLSSLTVSSSGSDLASALDTLKNAINTTITLAKSTAEMSGTSETSQSAKRVERDLQGIIPSDSPMSDAFKTLGIAMQDGALFVDANKFSTATAAAPALAQATLVQLGQAIEHMASTELDANGNVNGSLNLLKRYANTLQAQQSALQSAAQATAYSGSRVGASGYAVGAYQANI